MRVTAVALMLFAAVACSGSEQRVDGVVVAVDGGLSGVSSFEIVTESGERLQFVPDEGVDSFLDGAPLSHLNEHLQTGSPVRITYVEKDGVLTAILVDDAA